MQPMADFKLRAQKYTLTKLNKVIHADVERFKQEHTMIGIGSRLS